MDQHTSELNVGLQTLGLQDLHAWISWQHAAWLSWAEKHDSEWLKLPTGNPAFATVGAMFAHAFTPLHRYADQVLGQSPIDPPSGIDQDWLALKDWTQLCLQRNALAFPAVAADPARLVQFRTRSAGVLTVTAELALVHSLSHSFWHLGGIAHLLRAAGIEPPQRSDLIFWGMAQHMPV